MQQRRNRRTRLQTAGGRLTPGQKEILERGELLLNREDPGFETEAAERIAWQEHRMQLMAAARPGRRPHGFYKFDLAMNEPPDGWWRELKALLEHKLIEADEAMQIDRSDTMLSGNQSSNFCSAFDDLIRCSQLQMFHLGGMVDEFTTAAQWHAWRGRTELGELYHRRSKNVRVELARRNDKYTND